jgi:NTE family protein
LLSSGLDGRPKTGLSEATSAAVVIVEMAHLADAADLVRRLRDVSQERIDVAVLTNLDVTSDNGVGGLWDPAVVNLEREVVRRLANAEGVRWRFIPRIPGELGATGIATDNAFGRAIDRLARRLGRLEVGVALGAGMAKGFSHIGVLRALHRHGVSVDYLAGSSIGSIVGSVYAGGMTLEQLQELMTGADRRFVRLTLPLKSLSSNRGLRKILTGCHERAPTAEFPELFIPFAAVATDVTAGDEVVLRDGIVWSTVLASISMPGIFPPVVREGRVLADGGLVNPVPSRTLRDMGADFVIGIDLAAHSKSTGTGEKPRVPNLIEMLWRTMEIMLSEITVHSAANADVTIRPNTGHSHVRDFSRRGPEFIAAGEAAAEEALPQIARILSPGRRSEALP